MRLTLCVRVLAANRSLAGFCLQDVPHDALVLIASRIPWCDRLLRLSPVCKGLRDAAYAATTAVTVYEPADLAYLPHVETISAKLRSPDFDWLQGCARTLTCLDLHVSICTVAFSYVHPCSAWVQCGDDYAGSFDSFGPFRPMSLSLSLARAHTIKNLLTGSCLLDHQGRGVDWRPKW